MTAPPEAWGFLPDRQRRPWADAAKHGLGGGALFLGEGASPLEVVVGSAPAAPGRAELARIQKARRGGRAAPVLLVVRHPDGAALSGPVGESPPVWRTLDAGQVERLADESLRQPDRHAALRFLDQALPSLESDAIPGIRNEGLLALHELQDGVPKRSDWEEAGRKAKRAAGARDEALLGALGFEIARLDNHTRILKDRGRRTALAVLLRESESAESASERFSNLSPISYGFQKADENNLDWVVLVQSSRIRLYAVDGKEGVGRRGRTGTFVECQTSLLSDDRLPYLWLLYSAEALRADGSLREILDGSRRFAVALADRLRERIYDSVAPALARGVAEATAGADGERNLDRDYQMALTVLFRLLFLAYAEDRDLLPYRANDAYRRRSLKQKAQELAEAARKGTPAAPGDSHWREVALLSKAVAEGNPEWGVPAYDGGLFSGDPGVSGVGAALAGLTLPNAAFLPALRGLLLDETPEGGLGPVDFRSLGVREFGTIYEGLLESELAVADRDLALNAKGAYIPAKKGAKVAAPRGAVYLHNRSGARKSSGSYYTKPFAVDHLLDRALEPALDEHFARLSELDETDASAAFFDFRAADIAMGSGHFLIAAIDRIERRMAAYLAGRDLPGVRTELAGLRSAARAALGEELAAGMRIEDGQLLRRLIARRCIYGVDRNRLAVQLARLSVWIHTFVPGLPLSFLDHHLIEANSLVGIGTLEEVEEAYREAAKSLFSVNAESLLGEARAPLARLARMSDATLDDLDAAREAEREAQEAIAPTRDFFDLITARRISEDPAVRGFALSDWAYRKRDPEVRERAERAAAAARRELDSLRPCHFPVAFPEVFLGARPGFDAILGNPPWEKPKIEEHAFWARHFPGLRGRPQREQEAQKKRLRAERPDLVAAYGAELAETTRLRRTLTSGAFPGMGTGDPDLYKAFCWRFWQLACADAGRIGVVLPRSALAAKGSMDFRLEVLRQAPELDVTTLKNRDGWVFSDVTPQYTIALVVIARGSSDDTRLRLRGPYAARSESEAAGEGVLFFGSQVVTWNDTGSLPLLPEPDSAGVFSQLRKAPRLDGSSSPADSAKRAQVKGGQVKQLRSKEVRSKQLRSKEVRSKQLRSKEVRSNSSGQSQVGLAGPPRHGAPRHRPEGAHELRFAAASGLLAGVHRGIVRALESGHRQLLRAGGPGTGARPAAKEALAGAEQPAQPAQ